MPMPVAASMPATVELNAVQMRRQMKLNEAVKCFVGLLHEPHLYDKKGYKKLSGTSQSASQHAQDTPELVAASIWNNSSLNLLMCSSPPLMVCRQTVLAI